MAERQSIVKPSIYHIFNSLQHAVLAVVRLLSKEHMHVLYLIWLALFVAMSLLFIFLR